MNRGFATTRWSLVLSAQEGSSEQARQALAELCESYWYPLYAFVRRQGQDPDEARDLTQAYFAKLLEKDYINDVRPETGRFRSFLLASLKHFLFNEWDRARTLKRGGRVETVSLDATEAERRYLLEPADPTTPGALYEQKWAITVLDRSLIRLRRRYEESGGSLRFEELSQFLVSSGTGCSYRDMAQRLELSESGVKVAVHRLRKRFGRCLREELAETVRHPDEVDDEIRYLLSIAEQWEPTAVLLESVPSSHP